MVETRIAVLTSSPLKKFKEYPWLHIVDLDAAMEKARTTTCGETLQKSAKKVSR